MLHRYSYHFSTFNSTIQGDFTIHKLIILNFCSWRRLLDDDGRGVAEPLDEQVCVENKLNNTCEGLTVCWFPQLIFILSCILCLIDWMRRIGILKVKLEIDHAFFSFYISIWNFTPFFWNIWFYMIYQVRGNYYVGIHSSGAGSRWRRTTGQEIYSPLLLAFTHEVWVWLNSRYLHHGLIVITMLNLVTFLLIRTWKIGSRLIWLKELSWIQITPSLLMLLW